MKFNSLCISGWRQFRSIDITFDERMTVITGANGAGKTTLLSLLSNHFGWQRPLLATIEKSESGAFQYLTGIIRDLLRLDDPNAEVVNRIGSLSYGDGSTAQIIAPEASASQYSLKYKGKKEVQGLHIDSHRPISAYKELGSIPANQTRPADSYQSYTNELNTLLQGGYAQYGPAYKMKETLVAMAAFGGGNEFVSRNAEMYDAYISLMEVLRKVLPPSIGFIKFDIRPPEVVIVTRTGDFLLDAASGGLAALIDLCWRIHLFSYGKSSFVVTMDEPENHLHPSMQRSLMPSLMAAFPNAQFVIATHSPFMVSAVKDAAVYALDYDASDHKGRAAKEASALLGQSMITSQALDIRDRAGTANSILRDVLGVPSTTPIWVSNEIDSIVAEFRHRPITGETLNEMQARLDDLGYGDMYGDAIVGLRGPH